MSLELDYDALQDPEWLTSDDIAPSLFESRWERMFVDIADVKTQDVREQLERVVLSLEGLSKPGARKIMKWVEKNPDLWAWMIDWWYSRDAVLRIPQLTARFAKLAPAIVGTIRNIETNAYLRESTRCFLYGFFQASVVLARAALESALNDVLKRNLHSVPSMDLNGKINGAIRLNILSSRLGPAAHKVRNSANGVLHDKQIGEDGAFGRLKDVRAVLLNLYDR